MDIRIYVILAMALGILQLGAVSAASCNPTGAAFKVLGVMWGNSTHPISAGPGEMDVPLTVTIQSYGTNCDLIGIEGQLETYGGFSNFNGSSQYPTVYMQQIAPESIFSMVFNLNIAANVLAGPNASDDYFLYLYYNYTNNTAREEQSLAVDIPMHGSPSLAFVPRSRSLAPGQVNNITIQVQNTGSGYAYDVGAGIGSSTSLQLIGQPQKISSIAPGQTGNLTLSMYVSPSVAGQAVTLPLDAYYISPYGYNTSQDSNIALYAVAPESLVSLSTSTSTLPVGGIDYIDLIMTNEGASMLSNASATLSPQAPISLIGSDDYVNFGSIAPGKSASVPIELYVASSSSSSSSTVADLNVQLSYDGQTESAARTLSFLTPGYINFTQVSTTLLPTTPSIGSIFSLTSTLNNLGSSTASAVTVTAYAPKGLKIIGSNSTFLGSISPDNPTAFTVSFEALPNSKPGTYNIPVVLTYLNNLQQKVNVSMNYSVDVSNGTAGATGGTRTRQTGSGTRVTASGSGVVILAIIIIIIAAAAIYLYGRSKKKVQSR